MAERERVRAAIEGPVNEAAKLLDETPSVDEHARLQILVNGWGRGLAAGLEELAIAVGDLRRRADASSSAEPSEKPQSREEPAPERDQPRQIPPGLTEDQLREEAKRSRAETAALESDAADSPQV